jgi:hypothetical protein
VANTVTGILFVPYMIGLFTLGGQVAFMSYEFVSIGAKIAFGAALITCLVVFIYGWRQRNKRIGKILLAVSVVLWELLGVAAVAVSG